MIFIELFRVFLLSWVGLTGLLVMAGLFAEATQQGLNPGQILLVIPYLIPSTMPYTLPTTTLFATCVVYGRLAADNEVLAIKAAGIHLVHVIGPAMVLGALASLGTLGLYYDIIPSTHWDLRTKFVSDVEELLYSMLRKDNCIRHPKINFTIYVKRVEGKKLIDAQFMRRDPKTMQFDVVARAREAELHYDQAKHQIVVHMRYCQVTGGDAGISGTFDDKEWPIDVPGDFPNKTKSRATDMTWWEIFENKQKMEAERAEILQEIAVHQEKINAGLITNPEELKNLQKHLFNLGHVQRLKQSMARSYYAELHIRPALSLGCLCFVLVGCPVGIWFSKSDYLSAFITCFLPIVVLYYPLMLCGINMAKTGKLNPVIAVWPTNLIMLVLAALLFRKQLRN